MTINAKEQMDEYMKELEERSKKNTVDGYVASLKYCHLKLLLMLYKNVK